MTAIPARLRTSVVDRAAGRCEYCGLSQFGEEATFHIDHVILKSAGGETVLDNLAFACVSCSLRKEARQTAVDPLAGNSVRLFSPREDSWDEHLVWHEEHLAGMTAIGRATIAALQLNRPLILAIRREEMLRSRHPPV